MSSFEQKPKTQQQSSTVSASASAASSTNTTLTTTATAKSSYRLPSDTTLQHATKLAIVEDKPVMLDYWTDSLESKVLIGVKDNGEKMLVKSPEEYTSPVAKFYKSSNEYIIITENSIYLVSSQIPTRKIS
jgi:hypothetical protein